MGLQLLTLQKLLVLFISVPPIPITVPNTQQALSKFLVT